MDQNLKSKITSYHWLLFSICFVATVFAGIVSTLISVYLPVVVKDLLGDKAPGEMNNISAYINSIFIYGAALGGFISGIISDKIGRKPALILSVIIYSLFTILTGFLSEWTGVVVCRFFSGFGMSGTIVITTTFLIEEWPKKTRAILLGILSISMPVGIFSAGAIQYNIASWRQGFLIGIIPLVIGIISIWILRESVQWKKEIKENEAFSPSKDKLFGKAHGRDLIVGSIIFGTMLIGLWAIFLWIPTWIQSLIVNTDGQKERGLSMMLFGIGGLTGGFVSGWIVNAIGQKKSLILCFVVCFIMAMIMFKTNKSFNTFIYAEIATMAFFFGASQGVLSVYIPNMFPANIRGGATGFCFNIGRVFTATAVLFVGLLETFLGGYGNALFIFSFVFLIGLTVTLLSKNKEDDEIKNMVTRPLSQSDFNL